jgi:ADP-heptose:LPS heptosyltransferase
MKRVLLCRTDAVGDVILTLPVARSLKTAHPDMQITLLAAKYAAPLLAGENYLDNVVAIPGRSLDNLDEVNALARDLKRMNFDAAVLFYPRLSLALAMYLAKIPIRIGTSRRAYSILFNRRIKLRRRDSGKHELDLNYDLIEQEFGVLKRMEPLLAVLPDESKSSDRLLAQSGISERDSFVLIHPLSHGSAPNWPIERYAELAIRLIAKGHRIVITGSLLESDDVAAHFGRLGEGIVNLAGRTDLPQLKGIIKRAQLIISGSTGPIHMAGAVGTFAVGIYPPESTLSPVRWGPRGSANKLFVPSVDDSKSSIRDRMASIAVGPVVEFIISRLSADTKSRVNS